MHYNKTRFYSNSFVLPALLIYFIFFLLPAIVGLLFSFTDWYVGRMLTPKFVGLENFIAIFSMNDMRRAINNTVIFSILTVVFKNVLGLLLAVIINSSLIRLKNYYRLTMYIPNIMSFVVIGVLFSSILLPQGILNSFLGFIGINTNEIDWLMNIKVSMLAISAVDIWKCTGFHLTIYLAGIMSISKDYFEASTIDGASAIQEFRNITLPLIMPTFNVNFILSLIGGLKVFDQVYVLTNGGPGNATAVISTMSFKLFGEGRWGLSSAYNLILTVAITTISLLFLNTLRKREVEF
jgi:ABC-type sugar transport systems, permease components